MAENSKIEWTTHTFNPWWGCTKVAAGCEHCYAETFAKRTGKAKWGLSGTRVKMSADYWKKPIKWNCEAECNCGAAGSGDRECAFCAGGCERPRVFCASMADVFEDWDGDIHASQQRLVYRCLCGRTSEIEGTECKSCNRCNGLRLATMDDLRRDLFALIDATPNLDWLLLTKRPENICPMWPFEAHRTGSTVTTIVYRPNVWLLTSIATQADADKNIPELLKCRDLVPVLGVSAEPLVEAVNITRLGEVNGFASPGVDGLDWVIVGGESGHHARRFETTWAKSIIDQCKAAGVPCFVKQMGASCALHLDDPKGGDWSEWPSDLRVRQFPSVSQTV